MKISSGIQYMLYAVFTFSLMKVFVKSLSHIPVMEIILFRCIISLIISYALLIKQRIPVLGNNRKLLIGRGLAGAIALSMNYYLIHQIPLATTSTITYLAPVFSTLIGIFMVKEKVKWVQWFFFATSFAGVLMVQGFDTRISLFHLGIGITTSIFMGFAYNFVRKLNTTEHPLVIIFYFPLVLLPISSICATLYWVQPIGIDWFNLIMVGIITQIAQFYMTKAYQNAEISKVSILNYLGLFFSLLFGYFLFGESFNFMTYLGMGMVVLGVGLNILLKNRVA